MKLSVKSSYVTIAAIFFFDSAERNNLKSKINIKIKNLKKLCY